MKNCAYCGTDKNFTREHIIPASLIEFFPEQDITINSQRVFKDNRGPVISDVCQDCNNGFLSRLDTEGKNLISKYFLAKYDENDEVQIEYNYSMLARWLMKIAYNGERASKEEVTWFENNLSYILGGKHPAKFSIFAGVYVDMSPFEEGVMSDYIPLRVTPNPKLLEEGTAKEEQYKKLQGSFLFRFGSAMFLLFLWKDDINRELKKQLELQFIKKFPYSLLTDEGGAKLHRATDPIACMEIALIYGYKGRILNEAKAKRALGGRDYKDVRADVKSEYTEDFLKKGRLMNEHLMFPKDRNVKRELDKFFSKE
ncbi:hypothetical protein [Bacillus wiedmannii]|uniref:hypothetical protein n=1 Tax=Bacillus wiedmannii TaxID=1890302 RepID=UPI002E23DF39|nr:hypothetical protein [Bacillus wiedmannii]